MIEHSLSFDTTIQKRLGLKYLVFLPTRYESGAERFPLILFLHGTGERGDDLARVKQAGLPKRLDGWSDCPFIVVAPQCPADSIWTFQLDALSALLELVIDTYRIDARRIYLTGLSLGGNGTWYLATALPSRFAAIAPVCGRGTSQSVVHLLKDTPAWVFHGAQDQVVPVQESERMVQALREAGAEVRLTVYPDAAHDSWTRTYDTPELYDWFLRHSSP